MKGIELRKTLAYRCKDCGFGIRYSYIKNVKCVETRKIPGHVMGWCERDYTFEHKGNAYRVNEYIIPNKEGEKVYSAKYWYEVVKLS